MTRGTAKELDVIGAADELDIAPARPDGPLSDGQPKRHRSHLAPGRTLIPRPWRGGEQPDRGRAIAGKSLTQEGTKQWHTRPKTINRRAL